MHAESETLRERLQTLRQAEVFGLNSVRVNWQLKAILPVGFVLLAGLLLFTLATLSFRDPERHAVLIVAGAGAVAICAVSIVALAYVIQRPMVELQEKIGQVSEGNLNVAVGFSLARVVEARTSSAFHPARSGTRCCFPSA